MESTDINQPGASGTKALPQFGIPTAPVGGGPNSPIGTKPSLWSAAEQELAPTGAAPSSFPTAGFGSQPANISSEPVLMGSQPVPTAVQPSSFTATEAESLSKTTVQPELMGTGMGTGTGTEPGLLGARAAEPRTIGGEQEPLPPKHVTMATEPVLMGSQTAPTESQLAMMGGEPLPPTTTGLARSSPTTTSARQVPVVAPAPQHLGNNSELLTCPNCGTVMNTRIHRRPGVLAWASATCMFFFILWPFCVVPFFVPRCQDTVHECSSCGTYIGTDEANLC